MTQYGNDFTSTSLGLGHAIINALKIGGEENAAFAAFAIEQIFEHRRIEVVQLDDILNNDVKNNDGDLTVSYAALDILEMMDSGSYKPGTRSFGENYTFNYNDINRAGNNMGFGIVTALKLGGEQNVAFATYATQKLIQIGALDTRDVDDIIHADISNNDGELSAAYYAFDAFMQFKGTRAFDTIKNHYVSNYIITGRNIGDGIIKALKLGGEENIAFAAYATEQLGMNVKYSSDKTVRALEQGDIDNIINADIGNNDGDFSSAYYALEAYLSGNTLGLLTDLKVANNIGFSIISALKLGGQENVAFAADVTQKLSDRGYLETRDVDDIINNDVRNNDGDLATAYNALDAYISGHTQASLTKSFIDGVLLEGPDYTITANNIGTGIINALKLGGDKNVEFAAYATKEIGRLGVLETLDIDNIIEADVMNGDQDLSSAYAALEAFVSNYSERSGSAEIEDIIEFQDVADSVVNSAIKAQSILGSVGASFADTVETQLSSIVDTSSIV